MRQAETERITAETKIRAKLSLDGSGNANIDTGCGFLDHMLTLFTVHGLFDLELTCDGDHQVDDHHSTEDIGIVLGRLFARLIGDKAGLTRYGHIILPMDEALVLCAVDLSGRSHLTFDAVMPSPKVGTFDTELVKEFFLGFTREAGVTLHIRLLSGENTHHIIEGIFKAFGRTMRMAVRPDPELSGRIPSSKGVL